MPLSESQLLVDALEIKEEVIPNANSAARVGTMLENIIRSASKPYDPTAEYKAGQYIFYADTAWRCLANAAVGESPALVPTKWRVQLTKTFDQLTADKDFSSDSTDAVGGVAVFKLLPNGKWEIVRNGYQNVGDALMNRLTSGQLTSIYYGLNNEGRLYLANLLKLGGPEFTDNFYISGDNNTVYINRPGDPRTARGMAFINRTVNAQGVTRNDLAARMGWTPEGYLEMFLAGKRTVEFRDERTIFNTPDVQGNFDLTARSLNVSETPLADSFVYFPGLVYNETFKTWQVRYMGPKEYGAHLLSLPALAQLQSAAVGAGMTIVDHRILCHTVTVPAPTSQKITLTAAVDGQTFSHLLETDQLEYDVFAKTGSGAYKRDTSVSIGDITSTTFKLISPFPAFDGYIRIGNATL